MIVGNRPSIHPLLRLDWGVVISCLLLMLIGWMNIYSAVYNEEAASIFSFDQRYGKQFIWICAAIVIMIICTVVDSKVYFGLSYIVYALCILSLMAVLVVGYKSHGARSWFNFGSLQIQPSEFAKLAVSLALARYLGQDSPSLNKFVPLLKALAIIIAPPALIILQPDLGSCLVYLSFILVLYREGFSALLFYTGIGIVALLLLSLSFSDYVGWIMIGLIIIGFVYYSFYTGRHKETLKALAIWASSLLLCFVLNIMLHLSIDIVILISFALAACIYMIWGLLQHRFFVLWVSGYVLAALIFSASVPIGFSMLAPHQQERMLVVLGKKSDPFGIEYNVNQSKIAIGSGGLYGKGFLEGTQTKYDFVPEQSTDFIFCTVGEEWGFMGTMTVIGLYMFLLYRILRLAERQKSRYNRVFAYSVLCVLLLHLFVNIGMTIGLMPVIGIPLPFLSYGGSSLWAFTAMVFIMLKLDMDEADTR